MLLLCAFSLTAPASPVAADSGPLHGSVDRLAVADCVVSGFAADASTAEPVQIHFYAGARYGFGGRFVTRVWADVPRADGSRSGFSQDFGGSPELADGGTHDLHAYAVDPTGRWTALLLNASPIRLRCRAGEPEGDPEEGAAGGDPDGDAGIAVDTGQPYAIGAWYFTVWHHQSEFHAGNAAREFGERDVWGGVRQHVRGENPWGIANASEPVDHADREPLLGFYDLLDPRIVDAHILQAASRGLSYFAFYWYWDTDRNEEAVASRTLPAFFDSPAREHLRFVLAPIMLGRTPITLEAWRNDVVPRLVERYVSHPRYLTTTGGRPILYAFDFGFQGQSPSTQRQAIRILQDAVREHTGHAPVILWIAQPEHRASDLAFALENLGIDGTGCFHLPPSRPGEPYADTTERWLSTLMLQQRPFFHVPCASSGFDPRPWYRVGWSWPGGVNAVAHGVGMGPGSFEEHLRRDVKPYLDAMPDSTSRMLTIYAWNEWGEGGAIEPSLVHGYAHLDAIQRVFGLEPRVSAGEIARVLPDTDGDGVPDLEDNCTEVPNAAQRDSDADRFGNRCDADFDGDGRVDSRDRDRFRNQFGTSCALPDFDPALDADGDCRIGIPDFIVLRGLQSPVPGPSGLVRD